MGLVCGWFCWLVGFVVLWLFVSFSLFRLFVVWFGDFVLILGVYCCLWLVFGAGCFFGVGFGGAALAARFYSGWVVAYDFACVICVVRCTYEFV